MIWTYNKGDSVLTHHMYRNVWIFNTSLWSFTAAGFETSRQCSYIVTAFLSIPLLVTFESFCGFITAVVSIFHNRFNVFSILVSHFLTFSSSFYLSLRNFFSFCASVQLFSKLFHRTRQPNPSHLKSIGVKYWLYTSGAAAIPALKKNLYLEKQFLKSYFFNIAANPRWYYNT